MDTKKLPISGTVTIGRCNSMEFISISYAATNDCKYVSMTYEGQHSRQRKEKYFDTVAEMMECVVQLTTSETAREEFKNA